MNNASHIQILQPGEHDPATCKLPGCCAPIPELPGREGEVRYCSPEHRTEAMKQRRRDKYDR